jgi:hypothetical protein
MELRFLSLRGRRVLEWQYLLPEKDRCNQYQSQSGIAYAFTPVTLALPRKSGVLRRDIDGDPTRVLHDLQKLEACEKTPSLIFTSEKKIPHPAPG